jgi:uncharacterized protein YacL
VSRSIGSKFLLRISFVALVAAMATCIQPFDLSLPLSFLLGIVLASFGILLEIRISRAKLSSIAGGCLGLGVGGSLGILTSSLLPFPLYFSRGVATFLGSLVPLFGGFCGLLLGITKSHSMNLDPLHLFTRSQRDRTRSAKLLDTSVLIDGRIADITEAGFLEGPLVIPQFVLNELQAIADSSDSTKRLRGRRGLDIVQRLQHIPGIRVEISGNDFADVHEVDLKLIEAAKAMPANLVTTDFNLNKLAQVQGLTVLNINDLANAMRPVVLAGESLRVFIAKEGKEHSQGVAYLDDGTMVVVENARRYLGKTIEITVTSVLQTAAGKMIFGKYDERSRNLVGSSIATAG